MQQESCLGYWVLARSLHSSDGLQLSYEIVKLLFTVTRVDAFTFQFQHTRRSYVQQWAQLWQSLQTM